jgi:hypothetical protein
MVDKTLPTMALSKHAAWYDYSEKFAQGTRQEQIQ